MNTNEHIANFCQRYARSLLHLAFCASSLPLFMPFSIVAAAQQTPVADHLSQSKPYRLQPGDTVSVFYRLTPEYNQSLTILPDGDINLRLIGAVHIAGFEVQQAQQAILLEARKRLRDPEVTVSVTDFVRDQVTVMGEVGKPGRYELHGSTNLVDALAMANGFTTSSQQRKVILVRPLGPNSEYGNATVFDFKKLTKLDISTPMLTVQNGDIVIVTTSTLAKITAIIKLANFGIYYPLPNF